MAFTHRGKGQPDPYVKSYTETHDDAVYDRELRKSVPRKTFRKSEGPTKAVTVEEKN